MSDFMQTGQQAPADDVAARMISRTHVGHVRSRNEDTLAVEPARGLAILADGMGGLAAGDLASRTVVDCLRSVLLRRRGVHPDILARAIRQSDRRLHRQALQLGGSGSMGTTVVVWQRRDRHSALVAHVGDSRCYRERAGTLEQLTRDHSLVQAQLDAGLLTPQAAWSAPNRNLITQALGLGEPISVDVLQTQLCPGDRFLLCSDGLSDMVRPEELEALCGRTPDDEALADALVDAALAAGGRDNISLVLVRI